MKLALLRAVLLAVAGGLTSCCLEPDDPNLYPVERTGPPFHEDPKMNPADCQTPQMIMVPAGK